MNTPIHHQWDWNEELADDLARLIRLAIRADLERGCDVTSVSLLPHSLNGVAHVVAREPGVLAGLSGISTVIDQFDICVSWRSARSDGDAVGAGTVVGTLQGRALDLLVLERTLLNYLGHLSGIATETRRFVEAVAGTIAVICETRKGVPGWQRLGKYAVRCGGGVNHRTGLYDAVLIKDNHLAALASTRHLPSHDPSIVREAVRLAKTSSERLAGSLGVPSRLPIQIEVDTLEQFEAVLAESPDLVLLDNFCLEELSRAVAIRDERGPSVQLEASGGITLATVRDVAMTGVDRISVGRLTHSARSLDLALDWQWRSGEGGTTVG